MAEIRCPMCGRANPDDRDVCEFCGARLKPLTGSLAAANEEPIQAGDEPTPKSTSELEKTLPEWLRNIRKSEAEAATESAAELSGQGEPAEDDFFRRLSELNVEGESLEAEPAETAAETAPAEDDFLSRLSGLGVEPGAAPESQPAESAQEEPGEVPAPFDLAPDSENPEAEEEPVPASEAPGDDFLAGLSALGAATEAQPPAEPAFEQPEGAAEAPTDWLAGLSSAEAEDEEETPDWLKNLTGQMEQQAPAGPGPGAEAAPGETGAIDWRAQLERDEETAAAPPLKAEPEWIGFAGDTDLPAAELTEHAPESEESLDWLKDLEAQAGGGPASAPEMGAAGEAPGETPAAAAEEVPDWVRAATAAGATVVSIKPEEPAEEPEVAADAEASAPEAGTPDWLKELQADAGAIQPPPPETTAAAEAEEEVPDWLKAAAAAGATVIAIKPEGPSEEAGVGPAEAALEPEAGTPDWLKDLGADAGMTQPPPPETPAAAEAEEEIPDWLKAATLAGVTAAMIKPEESLPAEEQTPEWLSALGAEGSMAAAESHPEQEPLPDWLSGSAGQTPAGEPAAAEPAEAAPAEAGVAQGKQETPDWVRATLAAGAAAAALHAPEPPALVGDKPEPAEEELFPEAMPDWLADIQPAQEGATPPALPTGEAVISEGELPSWVQAMRPVEAAAGEGPGAEEEQVVEKSGPLSGFSNVLPAAVGAAGARKVSAYPNKMLVNESQQGQIELLERLVAGESATKPVGARERITSNRLLRWGIAALLLVFVMIPVMFGTQLTPAVRLYPPELGATIKAVNDLPAGATVLVVVDYQPAFSGEMEAATTPLLDHLRLEGATVVFVSSSSTGSALADRLVVRANSDLGGASPEQYINLGYLTGGASGITNFVSNPVQAAPQTVAGAPAWILPPLQDLHSLGDFDALVVLTDSSDTGAIWIEQSRTLLGRSPLLMAISAQAEPMLRPYYDSGQVQGMVTGLAGGVAYEQANGIPSIGSSYWDPFSVGFLVAEFIVAIGGVMALLAAWQARRAQAVKEAQ